MYTGANQPSIYDSTAEVDKFTFQSGQRRTTQMRGRTVNTTAPIELTVSEKPSQRLMLPDTCVALVQFTVIGCNQNQSGSVSTNRQHVSQGQVVASTMNGTIGTTGYSANTIVGTTNQFTITADSSPTASLIFTVTGSATETTVWEADTVVTVLSVPHFEVLRDR